MKVVIQKKAQIASHHSLASEPGGSAFQKHLDQTIWFLTFPVVEIRNKLDATPVGKQR